jgi:hypothetical protein
VVPVEEWIEDEFVQRTSHALVTSQGTWLIDPVDNPRIVKLVDVAGVIQLLDRHNPDCVTIARRAPETGRSPPTSWLTIACASVQECPPKAQPRGAATLACSTLPRRSLPVVLRFFA